ATHRRASTSDSDCGFSPLIGRSRSAPSQAAPAASSFLEAMVASWPLLVGMSRRISPGFIRVARIPERDAVPHHPGSAQQTRALDGVLAEPVAARVDRSLQPLATRA